MTMLDWMIVSRLPGVGKVTFWNLMNHFGSPGSVLAGSERELSAVVGPKVSRGFSLKKDIVKICEREVEVLSRMGGAVVCYNDSCYPPLLKETYLPPPVLYVLGNKEVLVEDYIGVVGSRASTSYGSRIAFDLARELSCYGLGIVSGLAAGIDSNAHSGALAADGVTAAVLGCGLDVVYPRNNRPLYDAIRKTGVIVTEYPLGTRPDGFRFPERNKIIAGMSHGVLVVEAAKKSGSLITAGIALEEGREVYAVPGRVDSCKSGGTHWLLKNGAKLVHRAADILEDMPYLHTVVTARRKTSAVADLLADREKNLLQLLEKYPLERNHVLRKSGMDITDFSESLLLLELEGLVEILPGDRIRRL